MAQEGYGVGAFGTGRTQRRGQTSQPGNYVAGLGGALQAAIMERRQGKYAYLTPVQEMELKRLYMTQLIDLKEREDKWRKGHLTSSNDSLKQAIDMHFKNVTAKGAASARSINLFQAESMRIPSTELGVLDMAAYTGNVDQYPGFAMPLKRGGPSLLGTVDQAFGGFTSGKGKLNEDADMGSMAEQIAANLEPKLKEPIRQGVGDISGYDGGLFTERRIEQETLGRIRTNTKATIRATHKDWDENKIDLSWAQVKNNLVKKGVLRENYGVIDSAAEQDRSEARKLMKPKVEAQKRALEAKGWVSGTDQERYNILFDLVMKNLNTKPGERPPELFDVPSIYTDEIEAIKAEMDRLENKDPYASEILRIRKLDGFNELKAAMGFKGAGYEVDRKAVFAMSKNPEATSRAFRLVHESRRAGLSDAKRDVMFRNFVKQEGLLGGRALSGFDTETAARVKMAGMTPTEVTMMDNTVSNYRKTKEFEIVQAPIADRYEEFKAEWLRESGFSEQAFTSPDGSLSFANAIAEGAWSDALASWMGKQKVYDNDTGIHSEETLGADLWETIKKDSVGVEDKAAAIAMARDTDLLAEEEPVPERTTYIDESGNKYTFSEGGIEVTGVGKEPVFLSELEDAIKIAKINDYLKHPDRKLTHVPEGPSAFEMVKGFEEGVEAEGEVGVPPEYPGAPPGLNREQAAAHHSRWLDKTAERRAKSIRRGTTGALNQSLKGLGGLEAPEETLERDWKALTEEQKQALAQERMGSPTESAVLEVDKPKKAKAKKKKAAKKTTEIEAGSLDELDSVLGTSTPAAQTEASNSELDELDAFLKT
mgnify:CR=1 FL=1